MRSGAHWWRQPNSFPSLTMIAMMMTAMGMMAKTTGALIFCAEVNIHTSQVKVPGAHGSQILHCNNVGMFLLSFCVQSPLSAKNLDFEKSGV